MVRSSCSTSKISIWWDIENCHVPRNVDPHYIAQNLRSALHHANLNGPITIDVFGDTRNLEHRILEALSSTGITINHIPSGNKDAADKAILVGMLFWALDNPPPAHFLLISGDGDFANALHRLRLKGYDILLARPDQPVKPALLGAATSVWYWTNVAKGQMPHPEDDKRAYGDSSGIQLRASHGSIDDAKSISSHRVAPQETDFPGNFPVSKSTRTYNAKIDMNGCSLGERQSYSCERDKSPTSAHSRCIQENVTVRGGDKTHLEVNPQAQKAESVSRTPTSNAANLSKQPYDLGHQLMQSGPGEIQFSKQSQDGYVSSNKITDFNSKGPAGISLPMTAMTGHLTGPPQDAQRAYNTNILKLMKTFERLKLDGLVPTHENLQHCLCYWDKQNGKVNLKQVLDQALNLGHIEKVYREKGGSTIFLPIKTELWSCFDVDDLHYAFSETLSKDFHQFLCCSKNWQFFLHSQSMYEVAQRLKREGPSGIRELALGEIIRFLNQAICKWKWLSLENMPTFSLSIRSQAVFTHSPPEEHIRVPSKSLQTDKDVPNNVVIRDNSEVYDASTRRLIFKKLRSWLKEIASSRSDYDVSLVPKDFERATGIYLDIKKLGFLKLQGLIEEFSDVVRVQVVRKGLKVLCPAATAQDKQQKGTLLTSQDKPRTGILPSPGDQQQTGSSSFQDKQETGILPPSGRNISKQLMDPTRYTVSVQEKQGPTQPLEAVIVTSQHVGALRVGATQACSEKAAGRNHPLLRKLRTWLLQFPSLKHGYDLSLIKKDFYQATGLVLDPPSLGYSKVKDIVNIFPEDFHVETPRHGLSLVFSSTKNVPATKSNAGSNRHNPGGQSLEHLASEGKPQQVSAKNKPGSVQQWKELHASARTASGNTSIVVEPTQEALACSYSLPPHGNAELPKENADESSCLTRSIS